MKPKQHLSLSDHFMGCLLGGALGDALGAPIEINRDFASLHQSYGDTGLDKMIPYTLSWGDTQSNGIGAITDDTTMLANTLEAINQTLTENGNADRLQYLSHQAYLHWGAPQQGGEPLKAHQDQSLLWSDEIKPFRFVCGAGRGTIAALQTGLMGTPEIPLVYDTEIRGKRVSGLNNGCGGMMRIAPLAFLAVGVSNIFNFAARNTALTHGHPDAYLAAACVAAMVHSMLNGKTGVNAILAMQDTLQQNFPTAGAECRRALSAGLNASSDVSTVAIDRIPADLGYKNPFLAIPVLAQVAYSLAISDDIAPGNNMEAFRKTLSIAVTHSGDSDSVGAIVGNLLGARWGRDALPADWLKDLKLKDELETLARPFLAHPHRIIKPTPETGALKIIP